MSKPLFYTVRRIRRGPRGGLQEVEVVRTIVTSLARAKALAKFEARGSLDEIDVIAIDAGKDELVVAEKVWSSRD